MASSCAAPIGAGGPPFTRRVLWAPRLPRAFPPSRNDKSATVGSSSVGAAIVGKNSNWAWVPRCSSVSLSSSGLGAPPKVVTGGGSSPLEVTDAVPEMMGADAVCLTLGGAGPGSSKGLGLGGWAPGVKCSQLGPGACGPAERASWPRAPIHHWASLLGPSLSGALLLGSSSGALLCFSPCPELLVGPSPSALGGPAPPAAPFLCFGWAVAHHPDSPAVGSEAAAPTCRYSGRVALAVVPLPVPASDSGRVAPGSSAPRKSARLARRVHLSTLARAKLRKARLLEGSTSAPATAVSTSLCLVPAAADISSVGSGMSWISAHSALCGVSLGPGDVRNLEAFLASSAF